MMARGERAELRGSTKTSSHLLMKLTKKVIENVAKACETSSEAEAAAEMKIEIFFSLICEPSKISKQNQLSIKNINQCPWLV